MGVACIALLFWNASCYTGHSRSGHVSISNVLVSDEVSSGCFSFTSNDREDSLSRSIRLAILIPIICISPVRDCNTTAVKDLKVQQLVEQGIRIRGKFCGAKFARVSLRCFLRVSKEFRCECYAK